MQADVKLVEIMRWANFMPTESETAQKPSSSAKTSNPSLHAATRGAERGEVSGSITSTSSNGVYSSPEVSFCSSSIEGLVVLYHNSGQPCPSEVLVSA